MVSTAVLCAIWGSEPEATTVLYRSVTGSWHGRSLCYLSALSFCFCPSLPDPIFGLLCGQLKGQVAGRTAPRFSAMPTPANYHPLLNLREKPPSSPGSGAGPGRDAGAGACGQETAVLCPPGPGGGSPRQGAFGDRREQPPSAGRRSSRALSPEDVPLSGARTGAASRGRAAVGPRPAVRAGPRGQRPVLGRGAPPRARPVPLAAGPRPRAARCGAAADYNSQRSAARPSGGGGRGNESGCPGSRLHLQAAA